jgi:hypothetical protein
MTQGTEHSTAMTALLACQQNLDEMKRFIQDYDDESVDLELQAEISRLAVLLQKIEKLVIGIEKRKSSQRDRRLRELNSLIEFMQMAMESLFQKVPNRELAKYIRIDIERSIYKYSHPFLGFFINRFMDIYRSKSVPLKVVTGLAVSSSIAATFIVACLLTFYFRPPSRIERQIADQEAFISRTLKENFPQKNIGVSILQPVETPASSENTQNITALAVQLGLRVDDPKLINLKNQIDVLSVLREQRDLERSDADLVLLAIMVFSSGALGSVISILTRINQFDTKQSEFSQYADPLLPIFTGAFKPIIGSSFGLLFFALINSGIITIQSISDGNDRTRDFFFCAVAFIVGFSERLATDVIRKTENTIAGIPSDNPSELTLELVQNLTNNVESLAGRMTTLESLLKEESDRNRTDAPKTVIIETSVEENEDNSTEPSRSIPGKS